MEPSVVVEDPLEIIRSFDEFREVGLLWLLNKSVVHPRGFAIAFEYGPTGELLGWKLVGDGKEPWTFFHPDEFAPFEKIQSCSERKMREYQSEW